MYLYPASQATHAERTVMLVHPSTHSIPAQSPQTIATPQSGCTKLVYIIIMFTKKTHAQWDGIVINSRTMSIIHTVTTHIKTYNRAVSVKHVQSSLTSKHY